MAVGVDGGGWVLLWFPIGNSAPTSRAWAGNARTQSPVRKNVAATLWLRNVARISGIASAFAPASNVNATTRLLVGSRTMSVPAKLPTEWGAEAGADVVAAGALAAGPEAVGCVVSEGDGVGGLPGAEADGDDAVEVDAAVGSEGTVGAAAPDRPAR